jgi:putative ABC transport system ATP-binding protein
MIDIEALEFGYPRGDFRLRLNRFRVAAGEKVAVTGPSGSGKTTLLNLLAGIATADRGRLRVAGEDVGALGDAARRAFRITRIGFVFQDFELVEYLTVIDNILHPYRISRALTLDAEVRRRARGLAERLGIGDKLARGVGELSQGERQRVAICRAVLPHPKLLLADEATGNLDPDNKLRILDLLFAEADEVGASVLAVTHDHALLPRFDRVVDFAEFRSPAHA